MPLHLFAGLRVRDFQAARPWYERLLGEPTFFPHATEAVWTLAEHRSVYVVEQSNGAGKSVATIFVDDLDAHMAEIAARGSQSGRCSASNAGHERVPVAGGDPLLVGPIEPSGLKEMLDATVGARPVRIIGREQDALNAHHL